MGSPQTASEQSMSTRSVNAPKTEAITDMEAALLQSRADVAVGRFVVESAQSHAARLDVLLAAAEEAPNQARSGPLLR